MVARGVDIGALASVVTVLGFFWISGATLAHRLTEAARKAIIDAPQLAVGNEVVSTWLIALTHRVAAALLPLLGAAMLAGLLVGIAQVGLLFAPAALKPDFERLNPVANIKRAFSLITLIESGKALFKLLVYGAIAFWIIHDASELALQLEPGPASLLQMMWKQGMRLFFWFAIAAGIFSAIDQFVVRRQFAKKMRMSRSDIKDELRHREGDSRIKHRRKQLQRELMKRTQSMRNLRDADLLITNPTHYAVALRYDAKTMSAPTITSRGAGDFALRLKRLAFIYRVPVVMAPELARGLFFDGAIDREIPRAFVRQTATLYVRVREHHQQGRFAA